MKPYLWALLAALAWGFAPLFEKIGLAKMPVFAGLFYRSLGVIIGLALLMAFKFPEIKYTLASGNTGWPLLVIGGFLASVIGQIFFYSALKDGQISQVVTIGASYPLISFALGVLFLGEAVTPAKLGGLALVVTGVMLLK